MSNPRFPDPFGRRELLEPGATASGGGLSLEQRLAALEQSRRRTGVIESTLPSNPIDGQVCHFQTSSMATDGIVWTFRYRANSGSSYKWEAYGVLPWGAEADPSRSYASASYGALSTDPITITTPVAGDYYIQQGAYIFGNTAAQDYYLSYSVGGTGALDADALISERVTSASGVNIASMFRQRRKNAIAASTAIAEKARATGGTGSYANRSLFMLPIRVG